MVYKGLRIQYSIRIVVLLATAGGTVYWITQAGSAVLPVLAIALLLLQIYSLLHLLERPQRDILRFFEAIEFSDFSQTFSSPGRDKTLEPLRAAFDTVMQAFQKARSEKEAQYRYFQTVIQHIGIGILVFTHDGRIDLINQRAKRILGVRRLTRIDQLSSQHPALPPALLDLGPDEATQIQLDDPESGDPVTLSLRAARFILHNEPLTLVSLQNIQSELESKESEAWQNLIRVLTHEIMNSITPISSLASTARDLIGAKGVALESEADGPGNETISDIRGALETIHRRSQGLLHFVETYRNLTRIPKPRIQVFPVDELFGRLRNLMLPQLSGKSIVLETNIEPGNMELNADPGLVEEVLINLVTNAMQALAGSAGGKIRVRALLDGRGRVLMDVTDNGPGITGEQLEKIFVPFYTTKPAGSGIGLSLCRGIMRMHRGTILARSNPGVETVFTLKF